MFGTYVNPTEEQTFTETVQLHRFRNILMFIYHKGGAIEQNLELFFLVLRFII